MLLSAFSKCPHLLEAKPVPRPGVFGLAHHRIKTKTWVWEVYLGLDSQKQEKESEKNETTKKAKLSSGTHEKCTE